MTQQDSRRPEEELIEARIKKLEKLKELGINPWPYSFKRTHTLQEVREQFETIKEEQYSDVEVKVAGRILSIREFGKLYFVVIQDATSKLQIVFSLDKSGEDVFKIVKLLDVGDFIGVGGNVFRTKKGELSVLAKSLKFLAKSIRPWPEKYHGIKDIELKYRKRYLDLVLDEESYQSFIKRSQIIDAVREFLKSQGFIEVETPILEKTYGGASAKPFITHLNDLDMDVYLRISLELPLKKLLVGRFEKVFQIGKVFRNESIDRTHNPEFTMVEAYWAYTDYNDMMSLVENLYYYVAKKVLGTSKITWEGKTVDLTPPWERLTMREAFIKYYGQDVLSLPDEELFKIVEEEGIEYEGKLTRAEAIDSLLKKFVEPHLIGPVFLIDHAEETTPLCKQHRKEKGLIERAEPYIFGIEVANIYSELNDPFRQRYLFELQAKAREEGAEETHPFDEEFLEALEYGMPPASGMGIGIDRMVMLFLGKSSIRDVLFFPFMK